ncbi:biotin/lipoyl-binding protein [Cellulosilyticum ruminicola]|uniref:biotin/lipoyl-binding protein n=1 Tax=Cellulosilyticum ruminicola TaxID=425254 RepID=UPI0006CF7CAA|nr:biotin/lipoyl-binding protein [Cellulosilyticum ruminicola]
MKKGYILIALMVMLVGTGCGYQKDANQGKAVTAETTTDAKKQTLEFYGQVIDGEGEEIFVDFPGYIEKVYVKEGMIVNKGDVLATFNNTDYLAEIAALKSEIAIDEVKLQQLKANVNPLVADIQYTQSQLEQYQVYKSDEDSAELLILKQKLQVKEKELQKEEKTYNDYQALYEVGGIAETELVKVDQNITETKAEIEEIKLQMQQIKDKYSKEIDNLEDKLTSLNQQLDYNQANEVYNLQVAELELKQKNEELKQKEVDYIQHIFKRMQLLQIRIK